MKAKYISDPEVGFIPDSVTEKRLTHRQIRSWIARVWNFVVDTLTQKPELQIREICDRAGNTWWYVYDPATGRTAWLDSENEVRIWIEKNY
jgi:YD repeat-containing protein